MILDGIKKSYLRMQGLESLFERRQLFKMFGNPEGAESDRDFAPVIQESSHQVGGQRAARHGVHGNNGERLSGRRRSEEHTSELQSRLHLVCRLLLEKKKQTDTCNLLQRR